MRGVLAQEGIEAEVELVAVNSDAETQTLRFPGSPTIRVSGEDLFPVPTRSAYALGCRMYATPEGLRGSPTAEMMRAALARRNLVPGVSLQRTRSRSPREADQHGNIGTRLVLAS